MTQKTLADLAGLSQVYVSEIETGVKPLDRKSTQVKIAQALNVSVAQLLGDPASPIDPAKDRAIAHVPAIRATLIEIGAGERRTPARDLDQARAAVRELTDLRQAADYAPLAAMLPSLLQDLAAHGTALGDCAVEALFAARYSLKTLGEPDLAREAAKIGVRIAEQYGNPAWLGQARYSWVQSFPPESAELGASVASRAADELQGAPERGALEVYGCLHLLAGYEAAVALRRDEAWRHLDEAADIARVVGEPPRTGRLSAGLNGNWFNPAQVEVWRVAVAAELGDTAAAVAVADRIDLDALPVPNRHVYYYTDLARALAAGGRDEQAMRALAQAERAAPLHFRLNRVVNHLVRTLIERARRRAVAHEFATMARGLGIHPY